MELCLLTACRACLVLLIQLRDGEKDVDGLSVLFLNSCSVNPKRTALVSMFGRLACPCPGTLKLPPKQGLSPSSHLRNQTSGYNTLNPC